MTNIELVRNLDEKDLAAFIIGYAEIGQCDFCVHYMRERCKNEKGYGKCLDGVQLALEHEDNGIVDAIIKTGKDPKGNNYRIPSEFDFWKENFAKDEDILFSI